MSTTPPLMLPFSNMTRNEKMFYDDHITNKLIKQIDQQIYSMTNQKKTVIHTPPTTSFTPSLITTPAKPSIFLNNNNNEYDQHYEKERDSVLSQKTLNEHINQNDHSFLFHPSNISKSFQKEKVEKNQDEVNDDENNHYKRFQLEENEFDKLYKDLSSIHDKFNQIINKALNSLGDMKLKRLKALQTLNTHKNELLQENDNLQKKWHHLQNHAKEMELFLNQEKE
ncbi:unnamed protein product [Cunninghamella blakesleeana]